MINITCSLKILLASFILSNPIIERPKTTTYHPILPTAEVFVVEENYPRPLGTIISGISFDKRKIDFILDKLVGKVFPHLLYVNDEVLLQPIYIPYDSYYAYLPKVNSLVSPNNHSPSYNKIETPGSPVPEPDSVLIILLSLGIILLLKKNNRNRVPM